MEHLPAEVLDDILAHLDVPGICSLRLASPHLERMSRSIFTAVFTRLNVDFSLANQEWLASIATSEDIRLAVRRLHVGAWNRAKMDADRDPDMPVIFGRDGHWPRLDFQILDYSCEQVKRFVAVLSRFPNCTAVTVTTGGAQLRYPSRLKDIETSLRPSDALELILHAYSDPGTPPLRSLRTPVHRAERQHAATPDANVFAANLECLTLENDRETEGYHTTYASHFLPPAFTLKALRVVYCKAPFDCKLAPRKRSWAAPLLESLTLANVYVRGTELTALLSSLQGTLASLNIHNVYLSMGTWQGVMEYLHDTPFPALRWISMLDVTARDEFSFNWCPLWRARNELQVSCGGTFEFGRKMMVNLPVVKEHVKGVLFETAGGGSQGVKSALRAMMENQHARMPNDMECESVSSVEIRQIPVIGGKGHAGLYERWTGIPPE